MKALTIYQPWATLIMIGAKPYEFRKWPAPNYVHGQRIVIHASMRPMKLVEIIALDRSLQFHKGGGTGLNVALALPLIKRIRESIEGKGDPNSWPHLPIGFGLGTALLGVPKRAEDIFVDVPDSDRVDHHVWGWPLSGIEHFEPPILRPGKQGFWDWSRP